MRPDGAATARRPSLRAGGRGGPVVDAHCHAGTGDGFTAPADTRASLARYLPRARAAGIDRTVVFAPFTSDYTLANAEVARIVRAHPGRLLGYAFVHAQADRGRVRRVVGDAVDRFGFVGIKVHRHDARLTREICSVAAERRLPLLYDPMGEIAPVDLAAGEYPDVAFVIPHLGSFVDSWPAQRRLVDLMSRQPNVFVDTSGVRTFDLLLEVARRFPRRVLFGSDGPWLHPGLELAKIRLLGLPPEQEALVLGGTFVRLVTRIRRDRSRRGGVPVGGRAA